MGDEEILQRRAEELARPLDQTAAARSVRSILRFSHGGAGYAVDLDAVRQVVALTGAARLPQAAWPLVAITPVAGEIVPMIALDALTGKRAGAAVPAWGVAVDVADLVWCLPADRVDGVGTADDAAITWTETGSSSPEERGHGITPAGDTLLDLGALAAAAVPRPSPDPTPATRDGRDAR